MDNILFGLYSNLLGISWTLIQILTVIVYIVIIKKKRITGNQTAKAGFIMLSVVVITSIFRQDYVAGKISEYVLIIFCIAFIQQMTHFIKHENK